MSNGYGGQSFYGGMAQPRFPGPSRGGFVRSPVGEQMEPFQGANPYRPPVGEQMEPFQPMANPGYAPQMANPGTMPPPFGQNNVPPAPAAAAPAPFTGQDPTMNAPSIAGTPDGPPQGANTQGNPFDPNRQNYLGLFNHRANY